MALKRVGMPIPLRMLEPVSRGKLEDARTLMLVPLPPYPNKVADLKVRPFCSGEYQRLLKIFDTKHHISLEKLRVVLHVGNSIQQPIPFTSIPEVRRLAIKLKELADDIEHAEITGFLLAQTAKKYDAQEVVASTQDGGTIEVTNSPRVQRILRRLSSQQMDGETFAAQLRKRADIYERWLDDCEEELPPKEKRLGRLKRLFVGLYLTYKFDSLHIPYSDIAKLLNCFEGFGDGSLSDGRYNRDLREFRYACKDSWVLLFTIFSEFDPNGDEPRANILPNQNVDASPNEITHPLQYRIDLSAKGD